jgi:hypothetical protein
MSHTTPLRWPVALFVSAATPHRSGDQWLCVSSHINLQEKCNNTETFWGWIISQGLQNFDLCSKLMWLLGWEVNCFCAYSLIYCLFWLVYSFLLSQLNGCQVFSSEVPWQCTREGLLPLIEVSSWCIVEVVDSTTGNAPRPYVGRPFVLHIWNGSFRHLQRHSASTDARGLY